MWVFPLISNVVIRIGQLYSLKVCIVCAVELGRSVDPSYQAGEEGWHIHQQSIHRFQEENRKDAD